jgi:hypothetical protein
MDAASEEPDPFLTIETAVHDATTVTMPFTSETDTASLLIFDSSDSSR